MKYEFEDKNDGQYRDSDEFR